MSLNEINERLDEYASAYIECYEKLLSERALLAKCLDDGYLNLSKARSIIGCSSLSIMQVPAELDASIGVEEETVESDTVEHSEYKLVRRNDHQQQKLPPWFGVLTPLSLKSSHQSFSRSLHLITSICELQSKLNSLRLAYTEAKKQLDNN